MPGNEAADKVARECGAAGRGSPVVMLEGINVQVRRINRKHRSKRGSVPTAGDGALVAYSWCRTNRGPQQLAPSH